MITRKPRLRRARAWKKIAANPYLAYVSTYAGTGAAGQSLYVTFTFANTGGFDAFVPIKVIMPTNASTNPVVSYSRSDDGGATYETQMTIGAVLAVPSGALGGQTFVGNLILRDPGIYVVQVLTGGGSAATWSIQFGATVQLITAYA